MIYALALLQSVTSIGQTGGITAATVGSVDCNADGICHQSGNEVLWRYEITFRDPPCPKAAKSCMGGGLLNSGGNMFVTKEQCRYALYHDPNMLDPKTRRRVAGVLCYPVQVIDNHGR